MKSAWFLYLIFLCIIVRANGTCQYNRSLSLEFPVSINETTAVSQAVPQDVPMSAFVAPRLYGKPDENTCALTRRTVISILASVSYGGDIPVGPITTKAMELALDRLRGQPNWLPNYELVFELADDQCTGHGMINGVVPMMRNSDSAINRIPAYITSACESMGPITVGSVAKFFDYFMIGTNQPAMEVSTDRKRFSNYVSLAERFDTTVHLLAEFIGQIGWQHVAIMSDKLSYYDEVEDYYLIPYLGALNVSLLYIGKFSHAAVEEEEMEQAAAEFIKKDPRIIIMMADQGAGKACWLHRWGMYGPNYVTFFYYWADVYPVPGVPPNIPWCTVEMINEVLETAFIFGDSTHVETYGKNVSDSSGMSASDMEVLMAEKVQDPVSSPYWGFWSTFVYDVALVFGYALNTTEAILQQRNETLLDWVTTSANYRNNGRVIVDIMREAMFRTPVKGLKGVYDFSEHTGVNTRGFTPQTITQMQKDGNKNKPVLVAIYKSNNKPSERLVIFQDRLKWANRDGKPPRDSIHTSFHEVLTIDRAAYSVIIALAIVAFIGVMGVAMIGCMKTSCQACLEIPAVNNLNLNDYAIIVGNVVMLGQVFALPPPIKGNTDYGCTAMIAFLIIGYSSSMFGLISILEIEVVKNSRSANFRIKMGYFGMMLVMIGMTTALLTVSPLKTASRTLASYIAVNDSSLLIQDYTTECSFPWTRDDGGTSIASLAIAYGLVAVHLIALLRATYTCYELRSIKIVRSSKQARLMVTCFYCIILLFIACVLISMLEPNHTLIILSVITLCYVAVTTSFTLSNKMRLRAHGVPAVSVSISRFGKVGRSRSTKNDRSSEQPDEARNIDRETADNVSSRHGTE